MVRYYITIKKCIDADHEHKIDVTPQRVVMQKNGTQEVNTPVVKSPFDKDRFYTTVYDCTKQGKKIKATFKGDQAYPDVSPPDPLPIVTDVREVMEGDDKNWLEYERDQQQKLGAYFCGRADRYNDIWTALFGIYTGLLLLFGLMASGSSITLLKWPSGLLFLGPIIPWVFGIYFFFQIHNPSIVEMVPNSPEEIREQCYNANVNKAKNYRNGLWCFSIGILLIIVAVVAGFYFASASESGVDKVQFLILDNYVEDVKEIPVTIIPDTNITVVVTLHNTTNTGYRIGLDDDTIVELNKTWVKTVIWVSNASQQ